MNTHNDPLNSKLKLLKQFNRFISNGEAEEALTFLLTHYDVLVNKSRLSLQLAELIYEHRFIPSKQPQWPQAIFKCHSGSLLVFLIAQLTNEDVPIELKTIVSISAPKKRRKLFSNVWLLRPKCSLMTNLKSENTFVDWLAKEPLAIAPAILAAAHLEHHNLLNELTSHWFREGLIDKNTPFFLLSACSFPILKEFVFKALKLCFTLFILDGKALLILLECAFCIEQFELVISYSEVILDKDLQEKDFYNVTAKRLVAFAELDWSAQLTIEYRQFWYSKGLSFPYPDKILYTLQKAGAIDLELDLLKNLEFTTYPHSWITLSHRLLFQGPSRMDFDEWLMLYQKNPEEEHILFGLSRCLLQVRPLPDPIHEDRIKEYWGELIKYEEYTYLAGFFLVMLADTRTEAIELYDQLMLNDSLENVFIQKASLKYIRSLSYLKKWDKLKSFFTRKDIGHLHAVCTFDELEYHRLMSIQDNVPINEGEINSWLNRWEKLISLFVNGSKIEALVGHFINIDAFIRQYSAIGDEIITNDLYHDVILQIQCRAKAEAERLLSINELKYAGADNIMERLQTADLHALHRILVELIGQLGYKEDKYI